MAENDDLSSLIENSVASDMPIIISDKKGKDVGVVSQKDLLVSIVEGQDE
jgi:CBS-domain-containing membrane protein